MTITLHYVSAGPPSRATLLTLLALELPYTLLHVDTRKGEHLTAEYLRKNPQHTIPLLEDDDFYIWDSHAINAYLVNKYAEEDSLYPRDPRKRAIVDQRLHFDNGVLFASIRRLTTAIKEKKVSSVSEDVVRQYEENYDFVNKFLEGHTYIAGDNLTIADFSFVASLETTKTFVPINEKKFPLIQKYLEACNSTIIHYKEVNAAGAQDYVVRLKGYGFNFPSQ